MADGVFYTVTENSILQKVQAWITSRQEDPYDRGRCLPKTREGLEKAIEKMCEASCAVSVGLVLKQLQEDGHLTIASPVAIQYNTQSAEQATLYNSGSNLVNAVKKDRSLLPFEEEELRGVYVKAVQWIAACNKPKQLASLQNCLAQVCKYKRKVPPQQVVDELIEEHVLKIVYPMDILVYL